MKRLAARRYAGLLILSPTAAADPARQPADCSQVNMPSPSSRSGSGFGQGAWEEMDKMCARAHGKERVCLCKGRERGSVQERRMMRVGG